MPALTPYAGPRPSPARPWAPWVIGGAVVIAVSNAAQCGLNLLERHYQQQRLSPHPPSVDQVRAAVNAVRVLGTLTAIVVLAWLIVAILWSNHRRPRARLSRVRGVECRTGVADRDPRRLVGDVDRARRGADRDVRRTRGRAPGDERRRLRPLPRLSRAQQPRRAVAWMCWVLMAARATSRQDERESSVSEPPPVYASAGWPPARV